MLLLFIIGIANSCSEENSPPTTTTTTPEAPATAAPAQVTVPGSLVGKNAQLVNDELRKVGLVDTIYASQDADAFAPPLKNWTVIRLTPASGAAVFTTDTVLITVTKKHSPVTPVAPPVVSEPQQQPPAAPEPPPADSSPSDSTGDSPYYRNCAAARAAGAAPLHRGDLGYRPGLDRDSDGIACE